MTNEGRDFNPTRGTYNRRLLSRPKRMAGKPGIWAREYKAGWTIFTVKGIYKEGCSLEETKELLSVLQLKVTETTTGEGTNGTIPDSRQV